jgi:hypothetical protein
MHLFIYLFIYFITAHYYRNEEIYRLDPEKPEMEDKREEYG